MDVNDKFSVVCLLLMFLGLLIAFFANTKTKSGKKINATGIVIMAAGVLLLYSPRSNVAGYDVLFYCAVAIIFFAFYSVIKQLRKI